MAKWNETAAHTALADTIKTGDGAGAESQLTAAWRATRNPAVKALLLNLRSHLGGPTQRTLRVPDWVSRVEPLVSALARDAATPLQRSELHQAVATVAEHAPRLTPAQLMPVFDALAVLTDEPTLTVLCQALLTGEVLKKLTRPPQPGGAAVRTLKHAVQLARRAKDPEASRLVDGLRAVLQKNDAKYMVTDALFDLQWLTERVVKPPPVVALKLKWSQLSRGLQATSIRADVAPRVDAETLFASVYAAPDDLARRSVLADLLQEQGDPRGAFIALQLQGAEPLRAEALLKKHARAWLAAIRPLLTREFVFAQGFLSACTLRKVSLGQFKAAAGSPLWATVRRLDATYGPGLPSTANALEALTARNLEFLTPVRLHQLGATLRELRLFEAPRPGEQETLTEVISALPKLHRLVVHAMEPTLVSAVRAHRPALEIETSA